MGSENDIEGAEADLLAIFKEGLQLKGKQIAAQNCGLTEEAVKTLMNESAKKTREEVEKSIQLSKKQSTA